MPRPNKASWIGLALIATPLLFLRTTAAQVEGQAAPGQKQEESLDEVLARLLTSRVETLRRVEELVLQYYKNGIIPFEDVIEARIERMDAELELAGTQAERVALLTEQVEQARSLEEVYVERFAAQLATEVDVLRARAYRQDLEIRLVWERIGGGEEGK